MAKGTLSVDHTVKMIPLRVANRFVAQFHRHHKPVAGHKFSLGAFIDNELYGVAIVGRPVARKLDTGNTFEVTRLCVKERQTGVASRLYNEAAMWAWGHGASRVVTYTLEREAAKSLQWAKWKKSKVSSKGGSWSRPGRSRTSPNLGRKVRWEVELA